MEKNKNDYVLLSNINKFYICGMGEILKAVISKNLKPVKFEDNKIYIRREEVERLFKHRKPNKERNNV